MASGAERKEENHNREVDEELLLRQVTELTIGHRILSGRLTSKDDHVIRFTHPHQLKDLVDFSINSKPNNSHDEILELCQQAIHYSVQTGHPMFVNQLYHGADPIGLAGSWLAEALNTNGYTFEVAPFFILVEDAVLRHMRGFLGWKDHGYEGDGIFTPGGSISNMFAMVLARYKKFPDVKRKGTSNFQLVAFTSQEGHYSIGKAANWMGLGMDNVISVATDSSGRMIPSELEKEILQSLENGQIPFFVNATAGTTVLGAYDPLESLTDVCSRYNIWLHVDATWGGGALVSRKYSHLLRGIDKTDSVAWNTHKMLGAPLTCAAFLVKHKGLLQECNSVSAPYLFQPDRFYDVSYDTGDKTIQCGRKVDAFKLWLMWKARGDDGFEELVDNAFDNAQYFFNCILQRQNFRLVLPEISCTNVCFWYVPPRLQRRADVDSPEWWDDLSKVAPEIKKRMVEKGSLMIGYQPLTSKGLVNFFRLVVTGQPALTHQNMDFIIEEIERLGKDL